ncbi:hypothetical protein EC957_011494 [Mortierella hygrophila]|uniref:DUF4112 domain-containing protein n=1 Tax=Mortierella hygrophila TaxID=979708 RepID=A0A9P6F8N7_9FUNG|nr:hypothetical protein EC957_011494 [Mortierella hygrophila]
MATTHQTSHPAQIEPKGSKFKSFFTGGKKKKQIVLSARDAEILAQVKKRAKVLDTAINLGFAKIGLDPIIGLIPVAGDGITLMIAMRLIHTAKKADIPPSLSNQMYLNVAIDFGMGLVPVVGDFADFLFKANRRNAKLFEDFLYERAGQQAAEAELQAAANLHHQQLHQQALANFNAVNGGPSAPLQQQQPAKKGWFSRGGKDTVIEMGPPAGHVVK